MWWNKKCEVWEEKEDDGEVEEGWEREWDSWQIPGLWSSVLNAQEVSRCAKMTLYNNSFGFMLWVVYTLCVPRDNHEAANDPGSYFYLISLSPCSKTNLSSRCLRQLGVVAATMRNRARDAHVAHPDADFASRCHRDLRFVVTPSPFRNNFPCEIIDIITTP